MAGKQNLNDYVAEQIRNKIIQRHYIPGSRLPNEFKLAEEYGVCRYTIREAIKKLTATGLVEVERGRGTFVKEMLPSSYVKTMIDTIILEEQGIKEIFEARLAIEQKTAFLAAQNATAQQIETLREISRKMEEALELKKVNIYNDLDMQFHYNIAKMSGNKILCEILVILHDMVKLAIDKSAVKMGNRVNSLEGHRQILKHIENKDAELASGRMVDHLRHCLLLYDNKIEYTSGDEQQKQN